MSNKGQAIAKLCDDLMVEIDGAKGVVKNPLIN